MRRAGFLGIALTSVLAVGTAQGVDQTQTAPVSQGAQTPSFRAAAHDVSIYVTVFDRRGGLVTDLKKDDFEVYDNGVKQAVALWSNDPQPIRLVMMLDRSSSMIGNFDRERDAAEQFLAHLLPADKVRIGNFSVRIEIDPPTFTSDRDELIRILHGELQNGGDTPLWNATASAMNALEHLDERRVVLLFTDGYDSPGRVGYVNTTFDQVHTRTRTEDIMVYAIGLAEACNPGSSTGGAGADGPRYQGRGGPPIGVGGVDRSVPKPGGIPTVNPLLPGGRGQPLGPGVSIPLDKLLPRKTDKNCSGAKPDPSLQELAAEGGGGYYELKPSDDLAATFARVADELHRQYLLGFTPQHLDGKTHELEVRIKRPDLTIRARKTYDAR